MKPILLAGGGGDANWLYFLLPPIVFAAILEWGPVLFRKLKDKRGVKHEA